MDALQLSTTVDVADDTYDSRSHEHCMSRREVRLYEEQRVLEKQEPIEGQPLKIDHVDSLHHAFWNVNPDYTLFAFGGTIPKDQVDMRQMALRV